MHICRAIWSVPSNTTIEEHKRAAKYYCGLKGFDNDYIMFYNLEHSMLSLEVGFTPEQTSSPELPDSEEKKHVTEIGCITQNIAPFTSRKCLLFSNGDHERSKVL